MLKCAYFVAAGPQARGPGDEVRPAGDKARGTPDNVGADVLCVPRQRQHRARRTALAVLRISQRRAAVALALLLGLQSVATDVHLPALPMLTREFSARMDQAQMTLSAMFLAFGLAQMVWGPVADRHGRWPVLLAGLSLYTVASVGCLLAATSPVVWTLVRRALR